MAKLTKELANVISGKSVEIDRDNKVLSKIDVIKFLNWYSGFADPNDLKAYLIDYCTKNYSKETVNQISKLPIHEFTTYGSLARMVARGYTSSAYDFNKILNDKITSVKPEKEEKINPVLKPEKKKDNDNVPAYLEYLELSIDNIFGSNHKLEIPKDTGVSATNIKNFCAKQIDTLNMDIDNKCIDKRKATLAIAFLNDIITRTKTKTVSKPRKVSPAKIAKSVKCSRLQVGAFMAQSAIDTIGKKKLYAYDDKTRRLYCYISLAGGFTYKGTTLQNFDVEKSSFKTIRDKDKFFVMTSISQLNASYNGIKQIAKECTGRFNENMTILIYS